MSPGLPENRSREDGDDFQTTIAKPYPYRSNSTRLLPVRVRRPVPVQLLRLRLSRSLRAWLPTSRRSLKQLPPRLLTVNLRKSTGLRETHLRKQPPEALRLAFLCQRFPNKLRGHPQQRSHSLPLTQRKTIKALTSSPKMDPRLLRSRRKLTPKQSLQRSPRRLSQLLPVGQICLPRLQQLESQP